MLAKKTSLKDIAIIDILVLWSYIVKVCNSELFTLCEISSNFLFTTGVTGNQWSFIATKKTVEGVFHI